MPHLLPVSPEEGNLIDHVQLRVRHGDKPPVPVVPELDGKRGGRGQEVGAAGQRNVLRGYNSGKLCKSALI